MTKLNKFDLQASNQSTLPIAATKEEKPAVETKSEVKQERIAQNIQEQDECIILDD